MSVYLIKAIKSMVSVKQHHALSVWILQSLFCLGLHFGSLFGREMVSSNRCSLLSAKLAKCHGIVCTAEASLISVLTAYSSLAYLTH